MSDAQVARRLAARIKCAVDPSLKLGGFSVQVRAGSHV